METRLFDDLLFLLRYLVLERLMDLFSAYLERSATRFEMASLYSLVGDLAYRS